jgi:hypothetical protein
MKLAALFSNGAEIVAIESTKELSEDTPEFTYLFSRTDDGEKRVFGDNLMRIGVWYGCSTGSDSDNGAPCA